MVSESKYLSKNKQTLVTWLVAAANTDSLRLREPDDWPGHFDAVT